MNAQEHSGEFEMQLLEFGSRLQIESIGLRFDVLRRPLGLDFDPAELKKEDSEFHIGAVRANFVGGILLIKILDAHTAKFRQVAVDPALQHAGIGKKLNSFAEQFCLDKGIKRIELHARKTAVEFYLKNGYSVIGEEFTEVGIAHLKMFKLL